MIRPSFDLWKLFVKSAQAGSFAKAARMLNTDPAYVSKAIATLESHLGQPLFVRSRHSLKTTWLAESYFPKVCRAVTDVERLFDPSLLETNALHYRIAVPISLSKLFLHWISDFRQNTPEASFDVLSYDRDTGADMTLCDLVVMQRNLPAERVFVRPLGCVKRILVAAPEVIKKFHISSPEDLASIDLVCSRSSQTLVNGSGVKLTLDIKSVIRVKDSISALECALYNPYCSVGIPLWAAQEFLDDNRLMRVLPDWECESEPVWIARPKRHFKDQTHKALADFLAQKWLESERRQKQAENVCSYVSS